MAFILHKSSTRGHANYGWLDTWHTFSFGEYHDPARVHFGALRVLNDDTVVGGAGFGRHPHDNMEIISIPLDGALEHRDSLGNVQVIRTGDVQVISAGTGLVHAEKNSNPDLPARFLQIWVIPAERDVSPRYAQQHFSEEQLHNKLVPVVSPMGFPEGINIYQNAWFSMGRLDAGQTFFYQLQQKENGVYAFLIEGDIAINEIVLNRRDGLAISDTQELTIKINKDAHLLLMEVPV